MSPAGTTPLPSQHSSLSGIRMARIFQLRMAVMDGWSTGPSHMPKPWMHWNSPPERLAPSSRYGVLLAVSSWLPDTCRAGAVPGGGLLVGGVVGGVVGGRVVGGVVGGRVVGGAVVGGA